MFIDTMEVDMLMSKPLFLRLPSKPSAQLACTHIPPIVSNSILVIFLNGLGLPMSSWTQTISILRTNQVKASILAYDRFGQGQTTDRDPNDLDTQDPTHAHDMMSAVHDLDELIHVIQTSNPSLGSNPRLILIGNSIGCAIARLYAQHYPGTVGGLLLLDSTITNSNFVDIFPDPDDPSFEDTSLPSGITVQDLRNIRKGMAGRFHPDVGSAEGLSRRNLGELLPSADLPKLVGWSRDPAEVRGPYVTVVGHGWEAFAQEGLEKMGTSTAVIETYMNPFWWKYNEGLCRITEESRSKGPVEAVGAGHFVQKDRPDLVAEEVLSLVEVVERVM